MPGKPRPRYDTVPVEATVHRGDKRVNIPTAELADFAVKEEQAPYILRYPRDLSLDLIFMQVAILVQSRGIPRK